MPGKVGKKVLMSLGLCVRMKLSDEGVLEAHIWCAVFVCVCRGCWVGVGVRMPAER